MFRGVDGPVPLSSHVSASLSAAYAEPHRAYHTASHIADVLRWYRWVGEHSPWRSPVDVYIAILFHDVAYQPGARDNEARSAALAREWMAASDRACELILLTARHGALEPGDVDAEAARFLDCDMAVLGESPGEFDAYDRGVAIEYRHVDAEAFRAGRRAFLTGLLEKPRIFLSEEFHALLDGPARINLTRAIERLNVQVG